DMVKIPSCLVVFDTNDSAEIIECYGRLDQSYRATAGDFFHIEVAEYRMRNGVRVGRPRVLQWSAAEQRIAKPRILYVNDGFSIHIDQQIETSPARPCV